VVKIRLIRLGSCRSAIELRPRANEINYLEISTVNFVCHFFVTRSAMHAFAASPRGTDAALIPDRNAAFKPFRHQRQRRP
jgi:hypothetical protein